jgi:phage terminase large subunit
MNNIGPQEAEGAKSNDFPLKLQPLFLPARYKILHGGRGGAKSWGIARALLLMGASKTLRILCGREYQKSIEQSVHKLLCDQIRDMGLSDFYQVQKTRIIGANGTEFSFHGLHHNVDNIKSIEGTDIAWIEEAQVVSAGSWKKLIPTIRKDDSEIWVSFNPELEEDETYKRFVLRPPTGAVVIKINWSDNPWFPKVLRQEKDDLKAINYDEYLNVWEGHCKKSLEGAIYAKELREAAEENRILAIPWEKNKGVNAFFDLGRADKTSIWFMQEVGFEFRFINFYQNQGFHISHYLKYLKDLPYAYDMVYLPHDSQNELLAAEKTIEKQVRDAGFKVKVVPRIPKVALGIDAVRGLFNRCWFDEAKCADGLGSLRRYRYDVDPDTKQYSKDPLHDDNSHAADAFRYFAESYRQPAKKQAGNYIAPPSWQGM